MPNLGAPEIIGLVIIIVLLFGAKRLPEAARGLGRSLRIFKAETKGLTDSDSAVASTESAVVDKPAEKPAVESSARVEDDSTKA